MSRQARGLTLAEVMLALGVLAVGILTLVGYMATIHRAAREGKNQAMATMHARSIMERIRDSAVDFNQATSPAGYVQTRTEVLLEGEAQEEHNGNKRRSATIFHCSAKAESISGGVFSLVVKVDWPEHGRTREVILESRALQPPY